MTEPPPNMRQYWFIVLMAGLGLAASVSVFVVLLIVLSPFGWPR